jgi:acetylglutamate kinase
VTRRDGDGSTVPRRVVLKVGGRVSADAAAHALALAAAGQQVVVVHGAGPQISLEMERRGLVVEFVAGRRVTTAAGLDVVREALLRINAEICAAIGHLAVGLSGDEIGLRATRVLELGLVGDPLVSAPPQVVAALEAGKIPVIAPLAVGPLNVNADEAAASLAVGLGAERIAFITDVRGVLVDGGVLAELPVDDADLMLDRGAFDGGIVPKLIAAVHAVRSGVRATIGVTEVVA